MQPPIWALIMRIVAIPVVAFYDDFGFPIDHEIAIAGLDAFKEVPLLLGVILKLGKKTSIDNVSIYLGLKGTSPSPSNSMRLFIALSEDRITHIIALLDEAIKAKSISHNSSGRLVGKLFFAQTALYNRFARSTIQPLYRKVSASPYVHLISKRLSRISTWWEIALTTLPPRIASPG